MAAAALSAAQRLARSVPFAPLARLAAERRTLRQLWAMLHTIPGRWPAQIRRYLLARLARSWSRKRPRGAGGMRREKVPARTCGTGRVEVPVRQPRPLAVRHAL